MMTRILTRGYLWLLLALLYSPILIIMIFSFTEAKELYSLVENPVQLPSTFASVKENILIIMIGE